MSPIFEIREPDGWRVATRLEFVERLIRDGATADEVRAHDVYQTAGYPKRREIDARLAAPTTADAEWIEIVAAFERWQARDGNRDAVPPKDEMLAETQYGRDRFDRVLRRHGVRDARHLRSAVLRESGGGR